MRVCLLDCFVVCMFLDLGLVGGGGSVRKRGKDIGMAYSFDEEFVVIITI